MASLARKISDWVGADLITAEQGEKVLEFEQNRKSVLSPFLALGLVGVFAVGLGIVAIVAANWQDIPAGLKLTAMFAALAANAVAAVRVQGKKPAVFEALLFSQGILFFAAMGLVGQIFHLQSETWKTLAFWSALSFPPMLLTKKVLFGFLWEAAVFGAFLTSPFAEKVFDFWAEYFESSLCVSAFFMAVWGATLLTGKAKVFLTPVRWLSAAFAVLPLMNPDYMWHRNIPAVGFVSMAVWAAAAAGELYALKTPYKSLYPVCVVFATVLGGVNEQIVVFAAQLCVLVCLLFAAAQAKVVGLSRLLTLCLGIRLFAAYLELFGTLLSTGFGLIFTGMVILGLAVGWRKIDLKLKAGLK